MRSQRRGRDTAAVLVVTLLAACTLVAPRDPPATARIWDVRAARFVDERALVADLTVARFRLLGEIHDNPEHHAIRARLIVAIADAGARPAVVLEQFDLDADEALKAAQAAHADAEALATAGRFDRPSWRWPLHKAIIEAALRFSLPVRAGNLSREALRHAMAGGTDVDPGVKGYARLRAARWTATEAAAMGADIVAGHCGQLPEAMVPRIVLAQRVRDAAMAQALVDAATADGAILIAGDGHVRADIGVPLYLHAPGQPDAGARSVSLGIVEVEPKEARAADFPRQVVADNPGFDYVWLTPPVEREDPCATLRMPAAK